MSVRSELLDKVNSFTTEKETVAFISDLFTVLHEINVMTASELIENGIMSEERAKLKETQIDAWLRQANESVRDNIKMIALTKKLNEYNAIKAERDNLASKVARAKEIINEKETEIEKAKKGTKNELKKRLQLGRDRIVAIAETSTVLGKQINDNEQGVAVIDTINNIRENVRLLTEEMTALGLWDQDEVKPNVTPIEVISAEKPKTATRKTATKKAEPKSEVKTDDKKAENTDVAVEVDAFDEIKEPKKGKEAEQGEQIIMTEIQIDSKQEE